MTQALEVDRRCKVLEIGTGSGYQAAILAPLARRDLHRRASPPPARGPRGRCSSGWIWSTSPWCIGDGSLGLPEQAPFDRIILTAAAEDAPKPLLDQLAPGGIMVLPVGQSHSVQTLIKIVKSPDGPGVHRSRPGALRSARRGRRTGCVGLAGATKIWLQTCQDFSSPPRLNLTLAAAVCLGLAACAGGQPGNPSPAAVANSTPDSRGVITYASYQVAVARDGDTIATLSERVGASPEEVARRNGLPADYLLRAGEIVVLPDSVPRPDAAAGWSPDLAAAAIEGAPLPPPGSATATAAPSSENPFANGQTDPLIDPVRHRVEAGETVYSIARLYGVSVTALASWNGLGGDMTIRENQELLIPIVSTANQISSSVDTQPGQGTPVTPPPIASTPLPADLSPGADPASPDLGPVSHPAGRQAVRAGRRFEITRAYNAAKPNGVGYSRAGRRASARGGRRRGGADLRGDRRQRDDRADQPQRTTC